MECNETTWAGSVTDDAGRMHVIFCDACRTIDVDAWDGRRRRRSWGITYLDPKTLPRNRGALPKRPLRHRQRGILT